MKDRRESLNVFGTLVANALHAFIFNLENQRKTVLSYEEGRLRVRGVLPCSSIKAIRVELDEFFPGEYGVDLLSESDVSQMQNLQISVNGTLQYLDNLLREHSSYYEGYRYGASLMNLAKEPERIFYKLDRICVAPLYSLGEGRFFLRVAGCNANEIISYQLSHLLRKFVFKEEIRESECYGHHESNLWRTCQLGGANFGEIMCYLLRKAGQSPNSLTFCHEQMEGFTELDLSRLLDYIHPMDVASRTIYQQVGNVGWHELGQLSSLELPMSEFFDLLLEASVASLRDTPHSFQARLNSLSALFGIAKLDPAYVRKKVEEMTCITMRVLEGDLTVVRGQLEEVKKGRKAAKADFLERQEAYSSGLRFASNMLFWSRKIHFHDIESLSEENRGVYLQYLVEEMESGRPYYPCLTQYADFASLEQDVHQERLLRAAGKTQIAFMERLLGGAEALLKIKALQAACVPKEGQGEAVVSEAAPSAQAYAA